MLRKRSTLLKDRVATEAAVLLYSQQEKEYKQAKDKAASTLRARILPSNKAVAEELDRISDEGEGAFKKERLVRMRKEALSLMVMLGDFHPRLIGSVWRGTAHKNSDIDIEAFVPSPDAVLERLYQNSLNATKAEWQPMTKGKRIETAFHIYLRFSSGYQIEIVVRSPEKMSEIEKCEIYGDTIKGLNVHQLRKVLIENPYQRFLPS